MKSKELSSNKETYHSMISLAKITIIYLLLQRNDENVQGQVELFILSFLIIH